MLRKLKQLTFARRNDSACVIACFLIVMTLSLFPAKGYASTFVVTNTDLSTQSCDPTYYETLKARAWLEGQRKTMQAANYIYKPDSVLDYSCFDRMMNIAALETEQIFSEYHGGYCFPDSLDCAIERLIMEGTKDYLDDNFGHTFLGGNTDANRDTYNEHQHRMCRRMEMIWEFAKCINFSPEMDVDNFYSFLQYSGKEVRNLPEACTNNPATLWTTNVQKTYTPPAGWRSPILTEAASRDTDFATYVDPPGSTGPSPSPLSIITGVTGSSCGPYVRTGVSVKDNESILFRTGFPDGVCTNPGCAPNSSQTCVSVY